VPAVQNDKPTVRDVFVLEDAGGFRTWRCRLCIAHYFRNDGLLKPANPRHAPPRVRQDRNRYCSTTSEALVRLTPHRLGGAADLGSDETWRDDGDSYSDSPAKRIAIRQSKASSCAWRADVTGAYIFGEGQTLRR
jgi:hypothetical protein